MKATKKAQETDTARRGSPLEVLWAFTKLGLTSFGGPVAHLGYFREEIVQRRKWVDEHTYADLVALCQFLPGPASSQVGIALGTARAGRIGGLAAWIGFTMPSAVALILFAYGVQAAGDISDAGWLRGLKIVAVAIVALAVWGMARTLAPDKPRATLAILAAIAVVAWQTAFMQIAVIVIAGVLGWRLLQGSPGAERQARKAPISPAFGVICLGILATLLISLPLARQVLPSETLAVFDSFFRTGSLVFGGGHVVLPLLQAEVVPSGWVSNDAFIAGYGAAQAVPGPLFTFAAYLGAVERGWAMGLVALGGIFLPSFLLVFGALPFWEQLRANAGFRRALSGINAAVVGILLAALYNPVWTSAVHSPPDFALGLAAFGLLAFWKWPPWLVVVLTAAAGAAIAQL